MARFYQTSQSNFVADKMLELPYELMSNVILNADKNIDAVGNIDEAFEDVKILVEFLNPVNTLDAVLFAINKPLESVFDALAPLPCATLIAL